MTKAILTCIAVLLALQLLAQAPAGEARRNGGGQAMNIGHFYGRIVDAKTGRGIEAASVQLMQSRFDAVQKKKKDTVIAGMLTRAKGEFSLENLPVFGEFRLKISAIGYTSIDRTVAFDMKAGQGARNGDFSQALAGVDKDLGNIRLEQDAKLLEAVTVNGQKPLVSLGIDRKVFNVEKNITSAGGTAVDVMRNVPSVSVDIDGNVTLRNNAPQIFVDGRPTNLTLDQIPADAIQSVEIITNPSAKYDASGGTAGILNIVLKKNKRAGYSGNIRAGVDQRGKINAGGDVNVREGKINFFANANYGQRKSIGTGETDRLTRLGKNDSRLLQYDESINSGRFEFFRAGMDYFMDNRNTITLSGTYVNGQFTPSTTSNQYIDSLLSSGTRSSYTERPSDGTGRFENKGAQLSYKHNFAKAGEEWTADVNYNRMHNENNTLVHTRNFTSPGGSLKNQMDQLTSGGGNTQFVIFQTDYTNPITEKTKLEFGARAQIRNTDSHSDIYRDQGAGLIYFPQLSSKFSNTDRVYAAYGTFSNAIKNFGYQLGLRVESSDYTGDVHTTTPAQKDTAIHYTTSFPLSLFPSIFLSQKLRNNQELQVNFTRRVNRPNFFQLYPFTDYSDTLNLSRGNPGLRPEFTYSSEMSYQKSYGAGNSFLASVYYKYTDRLITRYQATEPNPLKENDTLLINTFINANSSYVGGVELISRQNLTKWWDLTSNLNLYTSKINVSDPTIPRQDGLYSWFFKINNSFRLPKNFSVQISGDYRSKTILPPGGSGGQGGQGGGGGRGGGGGFFGQAQTTSQGYIRPNYGVDAALKFEFLKEKRASISLSVSDIFRTRTYDVYSESFYFTQSSVRRRDPQFFRLNFNWRFGKFDVSLFKRKNMKGEMEGEQNSMQSAQQ